MLIVLPPLTFRTYQILPHTNSYFHCLYSSLDLLSLSLWSQYQCQYHVLALAALLLVPVLALALAPVLTQELVPILVRVLVLVPVRPSNK